MSPTINLEDEFNTKYFSRELLYSWLSPEKIKELFKKKVLVIGVGGLGSFSSTILFKSGVLDLTIMDFDNVEISNLHRQLFCVNDVGKPKAKLTSERLSSYFNGIKTKFMAEKFSEKNMAIIKDYDLIVDGTDNLFTRNLINKAIVFHQKPAVFAMIGNSKVMIYPKNINDPCLSCFLNIGKEIKKADVKNNPDKNNLEDSKYQISDQIENDTAKCSNDETKAVIAPVNVLASSIQSYIAIKMLLGISNGFDGKLITFDFNEMLLRKIEVKKNKNCLICKEQRK